MNIPYEQEDRGQAPPMILPSERADLLDKIQPTLIIGLIFHRLMGEVEKDGEWVKDPELTSRAISKLGAWDISTLMIPVSSQNVSLSKLKDHEIRARTLSIAKRAQIMCLKNWRIYGLKGADHFGFIHEIVFSNTFVTLKQPQEEGIRNMIKNISSGDIGYQQQEQQTGWDVFRK